MKVVVFICLQIFFTVAIAQVNEKNLSDRSHWVIEYRNTELKSQSISVLIHNTDSNLKALVNLHKSRVEDGLYQGSFTVRFAKGASSPEAIDFYLGKARTLIRNFTIDANGVVIYKLAGNGVPTPPEKLKQLEATPNLPEKKEVVEDKLEQKLTPNIPAAATTVVKAPNVAELKKIEDDRNKTAQQETLLQAERLEKAAKLSAEQKKVRQKKSIELAEKGMEAYKAGKFKEAAALFNDASEQDPENFDFVYQHAICRYKLGQYNRSLSLLALSDGADINQTERAYYVALNHLKLQEYALALKEFKEIKEEKDSTFSPLASFFAGHIEFRNQKYQEARKDFEDVIDQSRDPQLDREAEAMLDEIDKLEAFIAASKEKYKYSLYIGPIYDSNVVNMSSSLLPTDVSAWRASYGGSFTYRMLRNPKYSVDAELAVNDYYSLDKSFQVNSTLQAADSLEFVAGLPVHAGQFDLTPSLKMLYLAPSSGGARTLAISSVVLGGEWRQTWTSTMLARYRGEVSSDTSMLTTASADDNQSGLRSTVGGTLIKYLDLKGETSLSTDLSYALNSATGKNYQSTKPALSVSYAYQGFWQQPAAFRLDYASQNYANATTPRTDVSYGATWTQNKKLSGHWNVGLSANMSMSQSNVSTYEYNKYSLSSLFTYSASVQK